MQPAPQAFTLQRASAVAVALIAWFCVGLQLYLTEESLANFFSYFTILCNLLIAVSLTASSLFPHTSLGVFFSKLSVQSAIALYIFIVSLVYNLVLRGIWVFSGWQLFVDNMLHVVVPILYFLFWLFFRTKGTLKWQDGVYWILFPLAYVIYSLVRGSFVNWYAYPFLNAAKQGYPQVFFNITIILAVFLVAGLTLIFITRSVKKGKVSLE